MVVEGSILLEGSFMIQDAGGVQWPRVQEAWKKSAPLFAFVVTIFLVCSLLSYLCHFLGVQALLFRLLDSCHYLNVTLVPYPPTFLPVFTSHSLSFVLVQNLSFLSPTSLHCLCRHIVPGMHASIIVIKVTQIISHYLLNLGSMHQMFIV